MARKLLRFGTALSAVLVACVVSTAFAQDKSEDDLSTLEWSDETSLARTLPLRERAEALTKEDAAKLREQLRSNPKDIKTRLVLIFHEEPELRRKRGARYDPKPHGQLVLGLIEQHPRSQTSGSAGLLLYAYKRDGMYPDAAWNEMVALWERLAAEQPRDPAIACNAGSFLISDPFRMAEEGPRALELLTRARELAPKVPRFALKLGAYHSMSRSSQRDPAVRAAQAKAGVPHLRAAWDLTEPAERAALDVWGQPLSMVLADLYFDADEPKSAREFAILALESENPEKPRGDVVFKMNAVLGRIALEDGKADAACRYLLAAGKTTGSPVLGSFGPDMALAKGLLVAGERDTVLEFLESCKVFWDSGEDRLAAWIQTIEAGGNPWDE